MRSSLVKWAARSCGAGLALAMGISAAAAGPVHAASLSTSKAEIVAHALQYAPRTVAFSPAAKESATRITGATATLTGESGSASLTASDSADSVVQDQPGGVRELTVLNHGSTAKFVLSLPAGTTLHATSTGGFLALNRAAQAMGMIAAPWAVDARGKLLPTRYTADGKVIVQSVDTRGAVYPIVADPSFHWYWDGVVITLSWADQMAVAEGGLTVLAPMLLASGFGWPLVWTVAWLSGWAGIYAAHDECYWFWVPFSNPLKTTWGTYHC
jgi:hypothetical protein